MTERFDGIVIGAGPGGEVAVERLHRGGMRVAVVERELIGGDCVNYACLPSKTLIRPVAAAAEDEHIAGVTKPKITWEEVAAYRDDVIHHLDDTAQVQDYERQGITFIRGEAHLTDAGYVEVAGRTLEAPRVLLATGSDAYVPPIEGLSDAGYWTNREATTFEQLPESIVILGGSAQSIELAQMFRRYGTQVTVVHRGARLLTREEPEVGELLGACSAPKGWACGSDAKSPG